MAGWPQIPQLSLSWRQLKLIRQLILGLCPRGQVLVGVGSAFLGLRRGCALQKVCATLHSLDCEMCSPLLGELRVVSCPAGFWRDCVPGTADLSWWAPDSNVSIWKGY